MIEIGWDRLISLCSTAITAAGGDEDTAAALTDAVIAAERRGNTIVGVPHLFDYLDALRSGRLSGSADGSPSSCSVRVIDISGVMPLPAGRNRYFGARWCAMLNRPSGPLMCSLSPTARLSCSQLDTGPPGTRLTVMVSPPDGVGGEEMV
jgi:hypothetical protein